MSPSDEDLLPVPKNQPQDRSCSNCHQLVVDDGYGEPTHKVDDPQKRLPFLYLYFCSTKRTQLATVR